MKKTFKLLVSLTLGIMIASCQNGLEEVIDESAVQDELATTRAEVETPIDEEIIEEYAVGPTIVGQKIITGTDTKTYLVSPPSNTSTRWNYDRSVCDSICESDSQLQIKLKNGNSTANLTITATFLNPNQSINSVSTIYVGANGPHWRDCSLRVVRASDGVEIYPIHNDYMEPNTYYYAYFSSSTAPYGMTLDWQYSYIENHDYSTYYTSYFHTNDNGYAVLDIYGKMPSSTIWKKLMGVTLY